MVSTTRFPHLQHLALYFCQVAGMFDLSVIQPALQIKKFRVKGVDSSVGVSQLGLHHESVSDSLIAIDISSKIIDPLFKLYNDSTQH